MGILDETVQIARRSIVLFFIVDTSYSMSGAKIGSLNQAIREILPMIGEISSNNADAEIKIAVLQFSNGCRWMFNEAKLASDFVWQDLTPDGMTCMGEACLELSSKLSKNGFLNAPEGSFAPALILLSDGGPTDDFNNGIRKLKENRWYNAAIKVAVAIGNDSNKEVLKEFTGNTESVIEVHNIDALKTIIRTVSVTASQIGSQSSTAANLTKQQVVNKEIKKTVENTKGASTAADTDITISSDDDWD